MKRYLKKIKDNTIWTWAQDLADQPDKFVEVTDQEAKFLQGQGPRPDKLNLNIIPVTLVAELSQLGSEQLEEVAQFAKRLQIPRPPIPDIPDESVHDDLKEHVMIQSNENSMVGLPPAPLPPPDPCSLEPPELTPTGDPEPSLLEDQPAPQPLPDDGGYKQPKRLYHMTKLQLAEYAEKVLGRSFDIEELTKVRLYEIIKKLDEKKKAKEKAKEK